jgi:lysozyme
MRKKTNNNELEVMCSENDIACMIRRHEGFRDRIYRDTAGILTVGWGHALQPGSKIPKSHLEDWFWRDFRTALAHYRWLKFDLDPIRKAVIVNMLFNMGLNGFLTFKRMIAAIEEEDFERAADEMLNSKWAGQVGPRASELAGMMRTGKREI